MVRIVESNYITSAVHPNSYPETIWRDFAFVGRSNVGKSSMINSITNRKLLAKIANKPGKTRLINFFEIRCKKSVPCSEDSVQHTENIGYFGLVDLPGYGYAKVSKTEREQWQKMINTFFSTRKQLAGAIVLVDIRHEADPKDAIMIKMLQDLNVKFMIAATKCDKIPKNKVDSQLKNFKLGFGLGDVFMCEFSSLKKIGMEKVLGWIEENIFLSENSGKTIVHDV